LLHYLCYKDEMHCTMPFRVVINDTCTRENVKHSIDVQL